MAEKKIQEIACAQVLQKETSILSVQWTVLPAERSHHVTSAYLLERYLSHIRRYSMYLINPVFCDEGLEFRMTGTRLALLCFESPRAASAEGHQSMTLSIKGGLLVQPEQCRRGELMFACEEVTGGTRVRLQLSDFCPLLLGGPAPSLWRKWLYRFTQAAIHRLVTVRFLLRLQRELAGGRICCRVVRIPDVEGEDI